jgi:hypothetical protein
MSSTEFNCTDRPLPEHKTRIPGVPDKALIKAAGTMGEIRWIKQDSRMLTQLVTPDFTLTADNNTDLVARLIEHFIATHQRKVVEPNPVGPVVCLID